MILSLIFNNSPLLFTIVSMVTGWISGRICDKPIQPVTINTKLNSTMDPHFYRPQRSCGEGNIFTPVCHYVHGGVSASVHAGIPPWSRHPPPGADTPPPGPDPRREADSRIRSMSGRYASYWNAFLLIILSGRISSCVNKASVWTRFNSKREFMAYSHGWKAEATSISNRLKDGNDKNSRLLFSSMTFQQNGYLSICVAKIFARWYRTNMEVKNCSKALFTLNVKVSLIFAVKYKRSVLLVTIEPILLEVWCQRKRSG